MRRAQKIGQQAASSVVLCGFVMLAGLGAGCVTSSEFEAHKVESSRLRARIDEMDTRYAEANKGMDRLRQVVDQANALLSRNSADLGAKFEQQEQDLSALKGKLEEARHLIDQLDARLKDESGKLAARMDVLEQGQQRIVDQVAPPAPENPEELFSGGLAKLKEGQRDDARRFLRAFIKRFPTDPRSATAYLAIGKSYADESNHRQAAGQYQKVLDEFPKSSEVPEAMYRLGEAFIGLKFCGDAKAIFQDLSQRFRKAPQAERAKDQLKALKKLADDKTRCTS